jgi:hypothetical protein
VAGGAEWFAQAADVPQSRWSRRADIPVDQGRQYLPACSSLDDLLLRVPSRVRRRFRKERAEFTAAGYTLHELSLAENLPEIVSLESRNRVKHGGSANTRRLTDLRLAMVRLLGDNLRVQGARDASGNLVACGIDLVDDERYLGLLYGQDDDSVTEVVYPVVSYSGPLLALFDERLETSVLSRTRTLDSAGDHWSFTEAESRQFG